MDFSTKLRIALDIAKGLTYLHDRGVFHRDLNTGNILVNDAYVAKLTDFGLSNDMNPRVATVGSIYQEERGGNTHLIWMAPELMGRGANCTDHSDMYAYGMVLWRLMTGKNPFSAISVDKLAAHIRSGGQEVIPDDLPVEVKNIIGACWNSNPNQRPEAADVVRQLRAVVAQHPASISQRLAGSEVVLPKPSFFSAEERCNEGQRCEKERSYDKAYRCYLESATAGYFRAQTNLGTLLLQGHGCEQNKAEAFSWFLKAAKHGHMRAQFNVGTMLELGDGVKQDLNQALHWYKQAANQGNDAAKQKVAVLSAPHGMRNHNH